MKRSAKVVFALSILFFAFFLFGITGVGQAALRGRIPPHASHWELDDIYMGAGLAPWVYGFVPSVVLFIVGTALLNWKRPNAR